jgi:RNA polymerase sigma-70 factor (ECF subfamily)
VTATGLTKVPAAAQGSELHRLVPGSGGREENRPIVVVVSEAAESKEMRKFRPRSGGLAAPDPSAAETERNPCDVGEFCEIARQHEAHLHIVALRLAGHGEIAKDLVQETLARALFHFAEFAQGTNARAWLTTILTRLYLDQRKHEKVVSKAGEALVTLEVVESNIDLTIPHVTDDALWTAVESLEPDLRQVVELRYMQQLSYKEIADRLRLRVGTVGTRLMRAHERLKALLHRET